MFLACGVGAFAAGIFHLFTHAFFKALLFLAAGSVIHALGGEQDLRKMGGLRQKIPWTFWTMLAGTLAIAGAPLFSGFFSKDVILWETYSSPYGNKWLWALALGGALLTAFYMFRLIFLAFYGAPRYDEENVHVHESPRNILGPLVVLAVFSVGAGWMALPILWGGADHFEEYVAPAFGVADALKEEAARASGALYSHGLELGLMALAIGVALAGFGIAWWFYLRRPETPGRLAENFHLPYKLLLNKYYVDEFYDALVVHPIHWLSRVAFWRGMDAGAIDGSANGLAKMARGLGDDLRHMQSGNTRSYAAWVVVGAAAVTSLLIWWSSKL
jgi:NADH-quinone oxidoreductase subunit L